MIIDNHID